MAQARPSNTDAADRRAGASPKRALQVNEDLRFQARDWLAQRVGWGLLAALVLAGLLGLLGSGPLSHVTRSDGHGLTVEYERFVRHSAPTTMTLAIAPRVLVSDQARITMGREYLVAHDLQRVVPEPDRTFVADDAVTFVFHAQPRAAMKVRLRIEPDALGRHRTTLRLGDGSPVVVDQFTYP
jgi:hypothetical protein